MKYFVEIGGRTREVELEERLGELQVRVDGEPVDVSYEEVDRLGQVALRLAGRAYAVSIDGDERACGVTVAGRFFAVEIEDERERAARAADKAREKSGGLLKSVMPGVVVEILVAEGDAVEQGQPLLILEAMKMQNEIAAPATGTVRSIHVAEGEAVAAGGKLATIE